MDTVAIRKPGEEKLKRNVLTIRFSDSEHRAVTNASWQAHSSASSYIRGIVLEHLRRQGVEVGE